MKAKSKKMVLVPAECVVITTENHGGYLGGRCIACGACGWLDPTNGYPYGSEQAAERGNRLEHRKDCVMNSVLNEDGSWRK